MYETIYFSHIQFNFNLLQHLLYCFFYTLKYKHYNNYINKKKFIFMKQKTFK